MQNSEPLLLLGWAVIIVSSLAIVIPVLRGKSDAITFWNIFHVSCITFIGIGCLEVVYGDFHWDQLQWFQPTRNDVQILVIGTILFYISIFASYYLLAKPVGKVTVRFLNKWPPNSLTLTLLMVAVALVATIGTMATTHIFYLGSLMLNISQKASVFAIVFTFCHWYQNKRQLPMLMLFLGLFVYLALFVMVTFVGRRLLMSVALGPVVCMYWLKWRYSSPKNILVGMLVAGFLTFGVALFYSSFRHSGVIWGKQGERSFANVIKAIESTDLDDMVNYFTSQSLHYFSQYTQHYSLLTIHLLEAREIEVEPLNTLKFLATYPIPRALWAGKPNALGGRIVTDVLRLDAYTNWGLGIVGHCWHEGGYLTVMFYGFLIVVLVRLLDDAMRRHPDNRFLIATLVAAAPHMLAFARGDTVTMSTEMLEAFAFAWLLGIAGRFMFGTDTQAARGGSLGRPLDFPGGRIYPARR